MPAHLHRKIKVITDTARGLQTPLAMLSGGKKLRGIAEESLKNREGGGTEL
jgi:hypothetical protein